MADNFRVATLEAPIIVKIPKKQIEMFKKELKEIQDSLEHIAKQMQNFGRTVNKTFKSTGKHLKFQNVTQNKFINGVKQSNQEQKKTESRAKRTSKIYGDWADKLAQVRVITGLIKFALAQIAKLVLIPTAAFAGFTLLAQRINAATAEMVNLSEATGFSVNDMRALALEAGNLGFTFEHINSLVEELNNKLGGEAGGFVENNLREGVAGLNVEVEKLQKMKPNEQFAAIMNASQDLVKKGRLAELASSFDKIFGQEGNRLLTSFALKMHDGNLTFEEFLQNSRQYVGLSADAIQGAKSFTSSFGIITASIKTLSAEFFGRFGKRLEPFFKNFINGFVKMPETMGKAFDEIIDIFADAFITGLEELINIFTWLRERPEEVKAALVGLVDLLRQMFKVGMNLAKALSALVPVLLTLSNLFLKISEFISWVLSSDIVRWFIKWGAAVGISVMAFTKLKGVLGGIAAGLTNIVQVAGFRLLSTFPKVGTVIAGAMAKGGLAIKAATALLGKFALAAGAGFGVGTLITKGLDKVTGGRFTGTIADAINGVTGSIRAEEEIWRQNDAQMKILKARMMANRARLASGDAINNVNSTSSQTNNKVENKNIQNTILVQDPITGDRIRDQIFNGRP